MNRRDFIKAAGGLIATALLPSCTEARDKENLLKNEDRPGFYIRFYKPFRPIDISKWSLEIKGLCKRPLRLKMDDIKGLPAQTQTSRLKCVECWSAKAKWKGFRPSVLFEIAQPLESARFLYFHSADDYYEYISIGDLLRPRVLFVYEMNDKPLPPEHGAPLRLIIPFKYGYKNVKTITRLIFTDKGKEGYWSKYGYSPDATIQPGLDYPLDIGETREIKKAGELGY